MQERARETREKIFLAAREEFSANGFHGARVERIAERAGVNKQRIYAYFKNKEDLFTEVLQAAFEDCAEEERGFLELAEEDIPHLPQTLLRHYLRFHETHPYFWRLLAWENLDGGVHALALRGIKEKAFGHLRALYATGQRAGHFPAGVSFETFMYMLYALSSFYFANRHTLNETLQIHLPASPRGAPFFDEILRALSFAEAEA